MVDTTDALPELVAGTADTEIAEDSEITSLQAQVTDLREALVDVIERLARIESFLHNQYNEAVILFDARLKAVEMATPEATNAELEATVKKLCEKMKFLVPMD